MFVMLKIICNLTVRTICLQFIRVLGHYVESEN
jgi:hypothetical protein